MTVSTKTTTLLGINAHGVDVETHIIGALKRFVIVGLPDGVVKEAKDRVRCAIENSGFEFPRNEVVVSLAPAALPKIGAQFDLAIALSILGASRKVPARVLRGKIVLGELALNGALKPVVGDLAAAVYAREIGIKEMLVPRQSAFLQKLLPDVKIIALNSLAETAAYLNGAITAPPSDADTPRVAPACERLDFSDVIGQNAPKRVLEIAAAGGHNVLMVGPPGAGKSMLARRVASILPPLTHDEALEVLKINQSSLQQKFRNSSGSNSDCVLPQRPFRAPHHTISTAGLVGGGSYPTPGEISLAHRGVLFLDEFAELKRDAIESLREPLENRQITLSRARYRVSFPAHFMLIAAMNPCPCGKRGNFDNGASVCECTPAVLARYFSRLSGPIADRIDLQIWVPPVSFKELTSVTPEDVTADLRNRVVLARSAQEKRFGDYATLNASMSPSALKKHCTFDSESRNLLETASSRFELSARAYGRVLKVARTIADLENSASIAKNHIAEALSYRLYQGRR